MSDAPKLSRKQRAHIEDVSVRLSRTRTWGGIETEPAYGPEHASPDHERDLGRPGSYPFTRGSYEQMYRSRMWTLRNIVGYGAPEDTLEGIRSALEAGSAGINVVIDALSQQCIDADHPAFEFEVGAEGCSISTAGDMTRLLQDIDISESGVAFHSTMMTYPLVAAAATRKGIPLARMLGSHMPDHIQLLLSGWGTKIVPAELAQKITSDCIEFSIRNSPRWSLGIPQAYDLRERGLTPAGEIGVGMAIVISTLEDLSRRGLGVDQVAPNLAWVSTSDIDFFEEVAKFRALRRVWARTMRERFGAADERSMRLRVSCHTAGKSLVYRQPLNNLARVAIETFAALCGGVQSIESCTWDEPISIPKPEARELATRTQQILAHEAGVARTADPLGGSYYVEALTNEVEKSALEILAQIEERGFMQAVSEGFIEDMMDRHNAQVERELNSQERVVIGENAFIPDEEPSPERFSFDRRNMEPHIRRLRELKASRDQAALEQRLRDVLGAERNGANSHAEMIAALLADGSIAEVWGAVRVAHGLPYDPYGTVQPPFDYGAF